MERWNKENKAIAVLGLGMDGAKCIYNLQKAGIAPVYCLTNNKKVDYFCGIPVFEISEKIKEELKEYIIIATSKHTYLEIANQLNQYKLKEFEDFLYYSFDRKKIVLLHGNCHMPILEKYLLSSKEFCNTYEIYPNPTICENKEKIISSNICKNINVWIHEDIQAENAYGYYLSDEWIRKNITKEVIDITIPHLFGLGRGFFPQASLKGNTRNSPINNGQILNGIFPNADEIIDQFAEKKWNKIDIINYCNSKNAIKKSEIKKIFKQYLDKIKEREKAWDIKIYEYIMQYYQEEQLFYDPGHPTNFILKKIAEDVLSYLDIPNKEISCEDTLDMHEIPVYPIVRKTLGLKWEKRFIRESSTAKSLNERMSFEDYIEQYLWWCHGYR